ncbi:MAG: DUF4442 domain-containing protein [Planctomycetota bacterium]
MGSTYLLKLLETASPEKFIRLFNRFGKWIIPFNRPHRLRIETLTNQLCITTIPYRRTNWNHLKGIHAGAIATLGEFTAGILLISNYGMSRYRLILSRLEVEYHYQGKTNLQASAQFDPADKDRIRELLEKGEPAVVEMKTELEDKNKNKVATVKTLWQMKSWDAVKTKV